MTKERLEELIKQGGEVYDRVRDKLIKLNKKTCRLVMSYPSKDIDMLEIEYKVGKYEYHYVDHYIANLTDDTNGIERAKNEIERLNWERKTYTERIERFKPPMLQDIKDKYIYTFVNGLTEYTFSVIKNKKHYCIGVIEYSLFDGSHNHLIDIEKATKEDYEKACEMVRDLFTGIKE